MIMECMYSWFYDLTFEIIMLRPCTHAYMHAQRYVYACSKMVTQVIKYVFYYAKIVTCKNKID